MEKYPSGSRAAYNSMKPNGYVSVDGVCGDGGLDNKGKRVEVRKSQYISCLCVFALENRGMENVIFWLRGNKSKQANLLVTERFRCQCLTSGQYR